MRVEGGGSRDRRFPGVGVGVTLGVGERMGVGLRVSYPSVDASSWPGRACGHARGYGAAPRGADPHRACWLAAAGVGWPGDVGTGVTEPVGVVLGAGQTFGERLGLPSSGGSSMRGSRTSPSFHWAHRSGTPRCRAPPTPAALVDLLMIVVCEAPLPICASFHRTGRFFRRFYRVSQRAPYLQSGRVQAVLAPPEGGYQHHGP